MPLVPTPHLALRLAIMLATCGVAGALSLPAANAQASLPGTVEQGPRFPGDYPLPPIDYMLHPTGTPPNGKPPEVNTAASPSMALAQEAAHAALAACEAQGLHVGVAVLDASGDLRVALSSERFPPGRVYIAIRKGLSALAFGVPTSRIPAIVAADPAQRAKLHDGMAAFPGGVPLITQGRVIGAVAASGARAVQDEACAAAGARAVASRLPG